MITYIENIIGATYAQKPTEFILCFMLLVWFCYMIIQLLYSLLNINK